MLPAEKGIDVVARIHPAELPQHLRLIATLEGHHRSFFARECLVRAAHVTGLGLREAQARSWAGVILTGSAGGASERSEAARARESVLGWPLRRATKKHKLR